MKVALYARVSLDLVDEDGKPRQTPENQLMPLRAYAKTQGFEVYDEYADKLSGADAHRPELDRMLADMRGNRFQMIVTAKVDRVARSVLNLLKLLEELKYNKVDIRFTDQPEISTDSPQGRFMLQILGAVAEFERELIRGRVKAGMARVKAQGIKVGREEVDAPIEKINELRKQGKSVREVARELGVSVGTVQNRRRLFKKGGG